MPQYSPSSLRRAVAQLLRHSLLQREDQPLPPGHAALTAWSEWNPIGGFFPFVDEGSAVRSRTTRRNFERSCGRRSRSRFRSPSKRYPKAKKIPLPAAVGRRRVCSRAARSANVAQILCQACAAFDAGKSARSDLGRPPLDRAAEDRIRRSENFAVGRSDAPDRSVCLGAQRGWIGRRLLSLQRRGSSPRAFEKWGDVARHHSASGEPMVVRPGGLRRISYGSLRAHAMEIRLRARVSRGADRGGTFVPDVLPDGDFDGACTVLHDGVCGLEDREGARARRNFGVGVVRGGSRHAAGERREDGEYFEWLA